jgi:hypothetical protein
LLNRGILQIEFGQLFSRPCGTGLASWAKFSRPYGTDSCALDTVFFHWAEAFMSAECYDPSVSESFHWRRRRILSDPT